MYFNKEKKDSLEKQLLTIYVTKQVKLTKEKENKKKMEDLKLKNYKQKIKIQNYLMEKLTNNNTNVITSLYEIKKKTNESEIENKNLEKKN